MVIAKHKSSLNMEVQIFTPPCIECNNLSPGLSCKGKGKIDQVFFYFEKKKDDVRLPQAISITIFPDKCN